MEQQLQQVDLELEENSGRVGIMDDHMKNVQQEITYAQHRVRMLEGSLLQPSLQQQCSSPVPVFIISGAQVLHATVMVGARVLCCPAG